MRCAAKNGEILSGAALEADRGYVLVHCAPQPRVKKMLAPPQKKLGPRRTLGPKNVKM